MRLVIATLLCLSCGAVSAQTITPPPGLPLSGGQMNGIIQQTVATNLTATGTTLATALSITSQINHVSSVPSGTGVRLVGSSGATIIVINAGANTLNVYPNSGGNINGGSNGVPVTLAAGSTGFYTCINGFAWFSK